MDTLTAIFRAVTALASVLIFGTGSLAFGMGLLPLPAFIVLMGAIVALVVYATEGLE